METFTQFTPRLKFEDFLSKNGYKMENDSELNAYHPMSRIYKNGNRQFSINYGARINVTYKDGKMIDKGRFVMFYMWDENMNWFVVPEKEDDFIRAIEGNLPTLF